MDQRFRWSDRLHRRADFSLVIRQGRRLSVGGLILWVYRHPAEKAGRPRLGLAIPSAFGNAVQRNRLKRLLREVFRLNRTKLPPGVDFVFSARPIAAPLRYQTVEPLVFQLWSRANVWPSQ